MHIKILPNGPIIQSIHCFHPPLLTFSSKSGFTRQYRKLGWHVVDAKKWIVEMPAGTEFIVINGMRYYLNQIINNVIPLVEAGWVVPSGHYWSKYRLHNGFNYRDPNDPRNSDYMMFAEKYAYTANLTRR